MGEAFWPEFFRRELTRLEAQGLRRRIPDLDHGAARFVEQGGARLLNLASNNYLGLAGTPELKDAAVRAVQEYGASSGASRLVSGQYALLDRLEAEAAQLKGTEAALAVGSGYAANLMLLQALADRHSVIFSDRLNHASIVDGIRLSGARMERYAHADPADLARRLEAHRGAARRLVVTDTVFSMDGDLAPLAEIAALAREHGALLVLDEAHATGVFGRGRGLGCERGVAGPDVLCMGTLGKALGAHGAFVAGSAEAVDFLRNTGRAFIFSTALPPAAAGAALAGFAALRRDPGAGQRLLDMARDLREFVQGLGFDAGPSKSQIVPVILGSNEAALRARDFLAARGVLAPAVRPPTVPAGTARLRLSLRADLTPGDLDQLRAALAALREAMPAWT